MSATLDTSLFQSYFNAAVLSVPGRQHPVEVMYTAEPQPDVLDAALTAVLQIHADEAQEGDVLVFLPGQVGDLGNQ